MGKYSSAGFIDYTISYEDKKPTRFELDERVKTVKDLIIEGVFISKGSLATVTKVEDVGHPNSDKDNIYCVTITFDKLFKHIQHLQIKDGDVESIDHESREKCKKIKEIGEKALKILKKI
jgi:hypothetical protein